MSATRRHLGTQLLMLLVVGTGLYFGYSFAREVVQAQRLGSQAAVGRQENDQLAAENRKLARALQYYQSDAYAELRARTDLNMRHKDEQIILPVLPPAAATPVDTAAGAGPAGAAATTAGSPGALVLAAPLAPTGRPWDRWFALFRLPGH